MGCSSDYGPPAPLATPTPTLRIADLQELYHDGVQIIRDGLVVEGVVTSSDASGNIYQTLYIEEDGAAIELLIDLNQIYPRYPVGCRLVVALEGLAMDRAYGVLRVGWPTSPSGRPALDLITSPPLLDGHLFRRDEVLEVVEPTLFTVSELQPQDCGRLVRFEELLYCPEEEAEEEPLWSGLRRFITPEGSYIFSSVTPYARFAGEPIPTTPLSLCGILRKGERGYQVLPRDEEDIQPYL